MLSILFSIYRNIFFSCNELKFRWKSAQQEQYLYISSNILFVFLVIDFFLAITWLVFINAFRRNRTIHFNVLYILIRLIRTYWTKTNSEEIIFFFTIYTLSMPSCSVLRSKHAVLNISTFQILPLDLTNYRLVTVGHLCGKCHQNVL